VIAAKVTSTSAGVAARVVLVQWRKKFNDHFERPYLELPPLSLFLAYAGALSASGRVKSTQSMTVPIQHTRFWSPRGADPQGVQLTSHPEQVIRQLPM
jgi:hypothetical protein